jgi:hypothetical protein
MRTFKVGNRQVSCFEGNKKAGEVMHTSYAERYVANVHRAEYI